MVSLINRIAPTRSLRARWIRTWQWQICSNHNECVSVKPGAAISSVVGQFDTPSMWLWCGVRFSFSHSNHAALWRVCAKSTYGCGAIIYHAFAVNNITNDHAQCGAMISYTYKHDHAQYGALIRLFILFREKHTIMHIMVQWSYNTRSCTLRCNDHTTR